MTDYYQILGISDNASNDEIKKAFKTLAFKYHPDKNKGDKNSEEKFKLINEAYQILVDPDTRRAFDLQRAYKAQTNTVYKRYQQPQPKEEKTVYNRYGRYNWKNAPKYKTAPVYKIDKNYYRNIMASFIIVGIMAAGSIAISKYIEIKREQEEMSMQQQFSTLLNAAQNYYDNGEYQSALGLISSLEERFPMEFRFYEKRETIIQEMDQAAITLFQNKEYQEAVSIFEVLANYQKPVRVSNYRLMAKCYLQLEDFKNAAHIYEFIIDRDPNNIELMLETAKLYELVGDGDKVLDYYNEARYTFKKFQERSYGTAFEFVIDPEKLPEVYYDMFVNRAKLLLENRDFEEAIKDCNWGIFLRSERPLLYYLRAQAKYEMGQTDRACKDINRAIERGYKKENIKFPIACT